MMLAIERGTLAPRLTRPHGLRYNFVIFAKGTTALIRSILVIQAPETGRA